MSNESEQKSILVPQHKRLAQGAPITGQTMKETGKNTASPLSKKK